MAIPGGSFTSSLKIHLIKNAIRPEWLPFGMSSEQLGDATFKLGSCTALGVGGRGFKDAGSQSLARNRAPDIPKRIKISIFDGTGPLRWPEAFGEEGFSLSARLFRKGVGGGPLKWGKRAGEASKPLGNQDVGREQPSPFSVVWSGSSFLRQLAGQRIAPGQVHRKIFLFNVPVSPHQNSFPVKRRAFQNFLLELSVLFGRVELPVDLHLTPICRNGGWTGVVKPSSSFSSYCYYDYYQYSYYD